MKYIRCCKDCSDRYLACHDTCEKYRQEYREYQDEKAERYKEAHKGDQYDGFRASQVLKAYKNRRHR